MYRDICTFRKVESVRAYLQRITTLLGRYGVKAVVHGVILSVNLG